MEHIKTEKSLRNIESVLKIIKAAKDRMTEDLKKVNSLDAEIYVEGYKEKKRSEISNNFEAFCQQHSSTLETAASAVIDAEMELDAAPIDFNDTSFTNALTVINSLGKDLPVEQQKDIAKQFRGNYAAERYLQALYVKLGLYFVIVPTQSEKLTRELYRAVIAFNHDREKSASAFRAIERAANNMLVAFNSRYKMDIGVSEASFVEHLHAGAGLKMTN